MTFSRIQTSTNNTGAPQTGFVNSTATIIQYQSQSTFLPQFLANSSLRILLNFHVRTYYHDRLLSVTTVLGHAETSEKTSAVGSFILSVTSEHTTEEG